MSEDESWRLSIHPDVPGDMAGISEADKRLILTRIEERLTRNPAEAGKRLKRELKSLIRLRVSKFRIIFEIRPAGRIVRVLYVGKREDVYKKASTVIERRK